MAYLDWTCKLANWIRALASGILRWLLWPLRTYDIQQSGGVPSYSLDELSRALCREVLRAIDDVSCNGRAAITPQNISFRVAVVEVPGFQGGPKTFQLARSAWQRSLRSTWVVFSWSAERPEAMSIEPHHP